MLALATDCLEPIAGGDFGELTLGRLVGEPSKKLRQCRAIAPMCRSRAVELDRVLAGLWQ